MERPKKGSAIFPKSEHEENIAFIFDGKKYVLWEDKQPHPLEKKKDIKTHEDMADWTHWLKHRYDDDPVGKLRLAKGQGGLLKTKILKFRPETIISLL